MSFNIVSGFRPVVKEVVNGLDADCYIEHNKPFIIVDKFYKYEGKHLIYSEKQEDIFRTIIADKLRGFDVLNGVVDIDTLVLQPGRYQLREKNTTTSKRVLANAKVGYYCVVEPDRVLYIPQFDTLQPTTDYPTVRVKLFGEVDYSDIFAMSDGTSRDKYQLSSEVADQLKQVFGFNVSVDTSAIIIIHNPPAGTLFDTHYFVENINEDEYPYYLILEKI